MQNIIEIVNGIPRHPLYRMNAPVNLTVKKGEHIAIVGPNGAGKSRLVDIMIGRWPLLKNEVRYNFASSNSNLVSDNIKYISFKDSYGDRNWNYYYQQRWNSQDMEITPTVADLIPEIKDYQLKNKLYRLFDIDSMLTKNIVLLSSGELRKFQLVKALAYNPNMLIIDNPYIGLDLQTRNMLSDLFQQMIESTELQLIFVLPITDSLPSFITHVIPVDNLICGEKIALNKYVTEQLNTTFSPFDKEKERLILELPYKDTNFSCQQIIKFNKVNIRYGEHVILNDIDWEVNNCEKWSLSGDNGSGKSTLLSLVCADNPQSYACNISLFGHKRGSGESIWEIKKHIGFVSPEMHRAYQKNIPAIEIVASGLNDSVGLYKRPSLEQKSICEWWMNIFDILDLKDRNFLELSSGEQRLVLLARAFVKDPELLILDEPFHGLDKYRCNTVKHIIETFCKRKNKTMIIVTHSKDELPICITHSLYLKRNFNKC